MFHSFGELPLHLVLSRDMSCLKRAALYNLPTIKVSAIIEREKALSKMGIFSRFAACPEKTAETKQDMAVLGSEIPMDSLEKDEERPASDKGKQDGVKKVEAAAAVWTKWHLVAAFAK